jgi:hypothetical protein
VNALEDPTLPLNTGAFAVIQQQVLALPGGQELLDASLAAQKESVAVAVREIFLVAAAVSALALVLCFLLREVPLRRDFSGAAAQQEPVPEGAPAAPEAALPATEPAGGT